MNKVYTFTPKEMEHILKTKFKAVDLIDTSSFEDCHRKYFRRMGFLINDAEILDRFRTEEERVENEAAKIDWINSQGSREFPENINVNLYFDEKNILIYSTVSAFICVIPKYIVQEILVIFKGNDFTTWQSYEYHAKFYLDKLEETLEKWNTRLYDCLIKHGYTDDFLQNYSSKRRA
ncbi:MAG: hypothetical protein ATN32_10215 [Candidatus Epulonipiscium fishelsonii]|nr:MAG: hypothetical protein ATN32_10215 [Epulopiscium sp. AS2M-Bin002]